MKIDNIDKLDLIVNISRHHISSVVEVVIDYKGVLIKASKRCPRVVQDEEMTQKKILKCLGFSKKQIEGLNLWLK